MKTVVKTSSFFDKLAVKTNTLREAVKGLNFGDIISAAFNLDSLDKLVTGYSSLEEKMIAVGEAQNKLGTGAVDTSEKVGQALNDQIVVSDKVKKKWEGLATTLEKNFGSALSGLISGTTSAKEAFAQLGKSIIKTIADFIAQEIIAATIGKALQAAATAAGIAQATILANAWAPAAALVSLATLGGNAAPAAAGMATVALLSKSLAVPLAEGGIVPATPGGRLALIGEGGKDEAVIPLDDEGSGIGGGIVININNPMGSAEDVTQLAEDLGFELERIIGIGRG